MQRTQNYFINMSYIKRLINDYQIIFKEVFTPDQYYDSVEDIDAQDLLDEGIKNIMLDVDNTLMTYKEKKAPIEKIQWLESIKLSGINIFLVSNNLSKRRIMGIAEQVDCPAIYFALKPFPFSTRSFMKMHDIRAASTAFVGDQLFKDVIVANWLKMTSILVNPINIRKSFFKTMQRQCELWILSKL